MVPSGYVKHNLHKSKCGPGQEMRLRRGSDKRYQFMSQQPTDGLEHCGCDEVTWEMSIS